MTIGMFIRALEFLPLFQYWWLIGYRQDMIPCAVLIFGFFFLFDFVRKQDDDSVPN